MNPYESLRESLQDPQQRAYRQLVERLRRPRVSWLRIALSLVL